MAEDRDIIAAVQGGDQERYRDLVERYQDRLYTYVLGLIPDPDAADDVTQESFIRAFRFLSHYNQDRATFSTWLFTIATNQAKTALGRRQTAPIESAATLAAETDLPAEAVQRARARSVQAAVAELPFDHRAAISLYYWQGLDYRETAAALDVPINTVRTWLRRAKQTLEKRLDEEL